MVKTRLDPTIGDTVDITLDVVGWQNILKKL
jgi:hypothetical protein